MHFQKPADDPPHPGGQLAVLGRGDVDLATGLRLLRLQGNVAQGAGVDISLHHVQWYHPHTQPAPHHGECTPQVRAAAAHVEVCLAAVGGLAEDGLDPLCQVVLGLGEPDQAGLLQVLYVGQRLLGCQVG